MNLLVGSLRMTVVIASKETAVSRGKAIGNSLLSMVTGVSQLPCPRYGIDLDKHWHYLTERL
jgi:hypothetical protein